MSDWTVMSVETRDLLMRAGKVEIIKEQEYGRQLYTSTSSLEDAWSRATNYLPHRSIRRNFNRELVFIRSRCSGREQVLCYRGLTSQVQYDGKEGWTRKY